MNSFKNRVTLGNLGQFRGRGEVVSFFCIWYLWNQKETIKQKDPRESVGGMFGALKSNMAAGGHLENCISNSVAFSAMWLRPSNPRLIFKRLDYSALFLIIFRVAQFSLLSYYQCYVFHNNFPPSDYDCYIHHYFVQLHSVGNMCSTFGKELLMFQYLAVRRSCSSSLILQIMSYFSLTKLWSHPHGVKW